MSVVADGQHPSVRFDAAERASILEKAKVRSDQGTAFRLGRHPYEEKEARELNRVGNHIAGELTERAVASWLHCHGVEHSRPDSLTDELERGLPDIATAVHDVKLDVKSTYFTPNEFRADAAQTRASEAHAIVWCKAVRDGYDPPDVYDSRVHEQAEVWGWTLVSDMRDGTQRGDELVVDSRAVRPLTTLLAWVKDGTIPPAPAAAPPGAAAQ